MKEENTDMLNSNMKGKIVLVTGATSGIGECIAVQLAKMGAKIVAVGRNKEKLQKLQQDFSNSIIPIEYDLMDLENIESIFQQCRSHNLMLDGLVHCAGIGFNNVVRTNNIDEMEQTMRINCFALLELGKFFSMKKYSNAESSLVAISSISSLRNEKGMSQYASSKAAVNSVVKVMAQEFMKRKIRVNAVLPALVKTAMLEGNIEQVEGYMETFKKEQPLGFIEPEQIAYMVEFLLSENAKYMTGELVVISGGMTY